MRKPGQLLHDLSKGCGLVTNVASAMALLKYFKTAPVSPNPNGPMSSQVLPSAIASANKEVKTLLDACSTEGNGGRGKYSVYMEEEKVKIAKWLKWE